MIIESYILQCFANPDEESNTLLENQDLMGLKASSFTVGNKKGNRKPRKAVMVANNRVERIAKYLNRSLISRTSGSKDQHTMVLTLKGARDRRMRFCGNSYQVILPPRKP